MAFVENHIELLNELMEAKTNFQVAKTNLEVLKANYELENDWESLLGVKKPTVAQKNAYITIQLQDKTNKVEALKRRVEYLSKLLEIRMMEVKY